MTVLLGTWSSPPVAGDVPRGNAAFTKVSPHQVIRCGGGGASSDIYMLDLSTMVSV